MSPIKKMAVKKNTSAIEKAVALNNHSFNQSPLKHKKDKEKIDFQNLHTYI